MIKHFIYTISVLFVCLNASAQLHPYFDKQEYQELLSQNKSDNTADSTDLTPAPKYSKKIYRSQEVGLKNLWELWDYKGVAVINVRGTTASPISWGENFYAAMVKATGTLNLEKDFVFNYQVADNELAKVHVGWLIGMAYLQRDILPKLDSLHKAGTNEIIIFGHSQGGAIAYLLSSHFHYLQKKGLIHQDMKFKTVTSAAPKPGNLAYAYDFEKINYGGWSYSVINAADWVPETPFSIQTLTDFNPANPFKNIDKALDKQKFLMRIYGRHIYKRLNNSTRKAQKTFEKYLGGKVYSVLNKQYPELEEPVYESSSAYVRVGYPVVLMPDEIYLKQKPYDSDKPFIHHLWWAYYQLADRLVP